MARTRTSSKNSGKQTSEAASTLARMRALAITQWRGARPLPAPQRNIHKASEHLEGLLEEFGITPGQDEESINAAWRFAAGEFVSKQTSVISFKKGVLVVHTLQPTMKFNLESMKSMILKKLKQQLGAKVVRSVVFRIG